MALVAETTTITLHKYESFCYFSLWTVGILYSIYKVYLINTYFDNYNDLYGDFAPGWMWIGRKQDVSDQEWRIWMPLILKLIPWMFFHHFVSHIIKSVWNSMLLCCCWYIFMSISFLYFYIGMSGMICALMQPSVLYIITYKCCRRTIWLINVLFLVIIHFLKTPHGVFQSLLKFNDEEHYILILIMCWNQLRSISYTLDNIEWHIKNNSNTVIYFLRNYLYKLAYCLYLPTLCLGPLILYQEFIKSLEKSLPVRKIMELGTFTLNLIRYSFWILFINFFLHFLYFNAIQYHPQVLKNVNAWALYGLGYCMGQFFLLKYVVVYGLNHIICALDNIQAPPQPKCVARIHLYSDMWKYFDQGLYKFLVRYIYIPLLKANFNKLLASFSCFSFVFIWHGMQLNIFIWAFLNFVGLNFESLIKSEDKNNYYFKILKNYISLANIRRLKCILTSPLLAMSVISNFYFFAGEEIGNIYIYRILHDSWKTTFVLLFFLYCCCQVSTDIKKWESQKKLNNTSQ